MRDYLLDIVQHTQSLGNVDLTKITGTATETVVDALAEDRSVVVQAKFKNPIPEFVGTFGMPNLGKLNTLLNIPEYKEDATITVTKADRADQKGVPTGLLFKNKAGDFENTYRFMSDVIVNEKLKSVKFKGVKWNVEFEPAVANILRLKFQAQAHNDETVFTAKTEDGDLKFFFGDHASHAGSFTFQAGVTGTMTRGLTLPLQAVITILNLPGDKKMYFGEEGAAMITVDSGIATYNYIMPAITK